MFTVLLKDFQSVNVTWSCYEKTSQEYCLDMEVVFFLITV